MGWIAVMTRSRQEVVARDALAEQLIAVALPQVRVIERRRLRGEAFRRVEALRPRLPCYLFARAVGARHVRLIHEARGVLAVVGVQGEPITVPDEVVEEVMRGSDDDGVVETLDYTVARALGPVGGRVVVQWPGNPYDGFVGSLAALEGRRARVWLRSLGGERSVRLPIERVRASA